jgi:hypothetical protein
MSHVRYEMNKNGVYNSAGRYIAMQPWTSAAFGSNALYSLCFALLPFLTHVYLVPMPPINSDASVTVTGGEVLALRVAIATVVWWEFYVLMGFLYVSLVHHMRMFYMMEEMGVLICPVRRRGALGHTASGGLHINAHSGIARYRYCTTGRYKAQGARCEVQGTAHLTSHITYPITFHYIPSHHIPPHHIIPHQGPSSP